MTTQCRFTTRLYNNNGNFMGLVTILPHTETQPFPAEKELRISYFSNASERCFPLIVLHTISSTGVVLKMEPADRQLSSELKDLEELHNLCLKEFKTAIILLEGIELHLVAMNNAKDHWPCFWGFSIPSGLYNACLGMLNLRCLALVFDLDETLIVANTMRSFEDRIDSLERRIRVELDAQRLLGMSAELKRYREDRALLKQFVDHDQVWDIDTNKLYTSTIETVPPLTEGATSLQRPIIRLQQQNLIFTRINPNVRDTSVLVRIRPAWGELRSYLIARGRKRFEVFVCTLSEKDYALEMWRLLDPEAKLIDPNLLLERIVCVKSGSKKSLENVFLHGCCHPRLAMVIDDRLKVWEDSDQPHVFVVQAFAPYYAPQAEINCTVPVLCMARNIACNVRSGFFKDFDDGLFKKMSEIMFDTDVATLPQPPDVINYLVSEEETMPSFAMVNDMKEFPDGMTGAEVAMRLKPQVPTSAFESSLGADDVKLDSSASQHLVVGKQMTSQATQLPDEAYSNGKQEVTPFQKDLTTVRQLKEAPSVNLLETTIQNSPAREEGEVPESELDPDTRRRLLILQHGQDTEHPRSAFEHQAGISFPLKLPFQSGAPAGGWLGPEEESFQQRLRSSSEINLEPESQLFAKQKSSVHFSLPGMEHMGHGPGSDIGKHKLEESSGEGRLTSTPKYLNYSHSEENILMNIMPASVAESQLQTDRLYTSSNPVTVLQEIAQTCNTRVEFKPLVITTKELQFSVEVVFGGDKVGGGVGRTKKEAQHRAAEDALRFMASQYISQPFKSGFGLGIEHRARASSNYIENDFVRPWNSRDPRFAAGLGAVPLQHDVALLSRPAKSSFLDFRPNDEPKISSDAIADLKDWGRVEGVNVIIRELPTGPLHSQEVLAQVEVAGQVIGKGSAPNSETAKRMAAEEALKHLKIAPHPYAEKRANSPRSTSYNSSKRPRPGESIQIVQQPSTTQIMSFNK